MSQINNIEQILLHSIIVVHKIDGTISSALIFNNQTVSDFEPMPDPMLLTGVPNLQAGVSLQKLTP